ncbi:hypothetical protein BGZ49_005245 [Haplosporangium sp. Z 27]|nr:hypothetical protein BGZ49_005245 [Haplosporangium sp. Z 27]
MAFDIREEDEHHDERHDEFEEYDDIKEPVRPKFYRRRKFWYCCIPTSIISIVVIVVIALYVVMPKIAQGLMDKATINFSQIDITNPSPTSMDLVMVGDMQHTGPFHADISFPGTVTVSWNGVDLGTTEIPGTSTASGGHGNLNLLSSFTITNSTAFAEFSGYMLNAQSFVWHLQGKLNVKALGHMVPNLNLNKDITVNAFNGLSGISIQKFSLPGDAPDGSGIIIEIDTLVTNPSSIQMYMGSLTLAISYKNTLMGYVTSNNLTMVRGSQTLSMKGVLIPQTTPEGLADTSDMMSRYIGNVVTDTIATGFDVKPDGTNSVDWLSAAVKNLKLTVPLQSPAPLQLIKALNLGALGLVFTPPTAYEPTTTSTGVLANYSLPDGFGFNIQFTQVANTFALSRNNVTIANLNSTYNNATSSMAAGTLTFNLLQTPLIVPQESHVAFQEFNRDLTTGSNLPFDVVGQASVYANTSIGIVNLVNIPFNATTELSGLQSLANPAPTITALQVTGGTTDALQLSITVVIINPSSISLNAGDVVLDLIYNGANLGTVTLPNLSIVPGANTIQATSSINPAGSSQGIELLTLYTSGTGAAVSIAGTPTSTQVESLSLAFGALNIGSQMPGLQSKLLAGAALVVLDTTLTNGLAQTVVTINNPFVPPMTILSIDSKITYNGIALGSVVSTFPSPPVIPGVGQGAITASLAMNTNPDDLTSLIRTQAIKNGINTDAFDALLSIGKGAKPPSSVFAGFSVADFVVKAMAGLAVDITLTTTVKLGDYQVTIPYTQSGVATTTDQTILKLIPIVGTPIAQQLVDGSAISFDSIKILSPTDTGFPTDIVGAITQTGPLDAIIQFPNAVTVSYEGKAIGTMSMPTVKAIANQGAALNLASVPFTITDIDAYTAFTSYALNNEKFDWTISSTGLVVNAMGVDLPGITLTKTVTLDGFNKLPGLELISYIINTIDDGGLHMVISAALSNPSTIGMVIPVSNFDTAFHGTVLGPAVAKGLTLLPHGNSSFALEATIATGHGDLTPYLTGIFQNALSGIATPLTAQGSGAPGVSWLDAAIKTLKLDTALPPLTAPPITSVNINAMSMDFSCDSCVWAPTAVSTISAITNLPFANGAPIVQLRQNLNVLDKSGAIVGNLNTPYAPAIASGNSVSATTPSAPLVIADGSHDIYSAFIKDLTAADSYTLGLSGTADSILDLGKLGQIEVKGIKIDVTTPLKGLQGLKDVSILQIPSVDLFDFAHIKVSSFVNIHNPSDLTLNIGTLQLLMGIDSTPAGLAALSVMENVILSPGDNEVVAMVHVDTVLYPSAMTVIFGTTNVSLPVVLYAYSESSKNPALNAGLSAVQINAVLPPNLVSPIDTKFYSQDWSVKFLPSTVQDGMAELSTTFYNPYRGTTMHFLNVQANPNDFPTIGVNEFTFPYNNQNNVLFHFLDETKFDVAPNASVPVTFKVKLNPVINRNALESWVNQTQTSSILNADTPALVVVLSLGNDKNLLPVDISSTGPSMYPSSHLNLHTGPDFAILLQWYNALYPPVAPVAPTTVSAAPSVVPTSAAPSSTSPSPTSAPAVSPSSVPTTSEPAPVPAPSPSASSSSSAPSPSPASPVPSTPPV